MSSQAKILATSLGSCDTARRFEGPL